MGIGIGLGLAIRGHGGSVAAPVLASINYDLADTTGGGQAIILTGTGLSGASSVAVGATNVSPSSYTSTTVTFTMPAKSAGTYNVTVTTPGGTSNALSIEAWDPTQDASLVFMVDAISHAYSGTAAWANRYNSVSGKTSIGLDKYSTYPTASGGAPVFDGVGAMYSSDNVATQVLYSDVFGATAGTIFLVASSTNNEALSTSAPYDNPCAVLNAAQGTLGNAYGGTGQWMAHAYTNAYQTVTANASSGAAHSIVQRWNSSQMELSVDSALSGGGYGTVALNSAPATAPYFNSAAYLGRSFSGALKKFRGTVYAVGFLNAKASDTFNTKSYKWAKQRFGVA